MKEGGGVAGAGRRTPSLTPSLTVRWRPVPLQAGEQRGGPAVGLDRGCAWGRGCGAGALLGGKRMLRTQIKAFLWVCGHS